ncbi:MAG: hypothetical protein QM676_04220 [Novosphingobium sp.]
MRPAFRLALILALPLAAAACNKAAEKKQKDQRTAAGEILPGSISDSMLPYDTVKSQPPLAPKETGKPGAAPKLSEGADEGPGDPPVDPADRQPAAPVEAPAAPTR